MTHVIVPVLARAASGIETEHSSSRPLGFAYFKGSVSLLGILAASANELFAMTVALHAQFPALSSGENLGQEIMPLRYAIAVCLPLGHILLRSAIGRLGRPLDWLLSGIGLVPIASILGGMAIFMFAATSQATGGDDGQTAIAGLAGPALGIVCAAMFSISFLASHTLAGKFLSALSTVVAGRAQRAKVADWKRELKAVDTCRTRIDAVQRTITAMEEPDALRWKAAVDAAAAVAPIAAEAHDLYDSCRAGSNVERLPGDTSDLPDDAPLDVLDQRRAYLARLANSQFFFDQLKNKKES